MILSIYMEIFYWCACIDKIIENMNEIIHKWVNARRFVVRGDIDRGR